MRTDAWKENDGNEAGRRLRRKKPWRYHWPDDFRDEVLARLLELNRRCAEVERFTGAGAAAGRDLGLKEKKAARAEKPKAGKRDEQQKLPGL